MLIESLLDFQDSLIGLAVNDLGIIAYRWMAIKVELTATDGIVSIFVLDILDLLPDIAVIGCCGTICRAVEIGAGDRLDADGLCRLIWKIVLEAYSSSHPGAAKSEGSKLFG
jgi:hypothetical protein